MSAPLWRLALSGVIGLGLSVPGAAVHASTMSAAATVRVRVVGIARDGRQVKVFATIFSTSVPPIVTSAAGAVSVPTGQHWIGAEVDTLGAGSQIISETLVMRRIRITRGETVRLDARPGKLVRFSFGAAGARDAADSVQACIGGTFLTGFGVGAGGSPGTLYVVPVRASVMTFGYGSSWQGPAAGYLISGHAAGGIPGRPRFRGSLSGMAKLSIQLRSGTTAGGYNNPALEPNSPCGVGSGLGLNPATGMTVTEYVTAGTWTTSVLGFRAFWQGTERVAAGHRYAVIFGGAVWGPSTQDSPQADAGRILFFPDSPFNDPVQPESLECCDTSSITLSLGGRVLKHEVLNQWRQVREFSAHAPRAGWYTMAIKAWRWTPGLVIPKNLLSRQETLIWRFHAAPSSVPSGYQQELPVQVARIWAAGLNIDNQATPGGATALRIHVVRPHAAGLPRAPRYRIKAVRLQASFDGGKTWRTLRLTRDGQSWVATVHDPAAGFVALRSRVTDSRGDSSIQTIYQAYAIG